MDIDETTRARSRLAEWLVRVVVALALLGSAWVHLDVWLGGYRQIDTLGQLFMVNVVVGVVLAVAVLVWEHWLPALAAVGFGLATLGAFVLSATVGLLTDNVLGGFHAAQEYGAAVAELVCIVGGCALLLSRRGGGGSGA